MNYRTLENILSEIKQKDTSVLCREVQIIEALQYGIDHFDMDELAKRRQSKRTL